MFRTALLTALIAFVPPLMAATAPQPSMTQPDDLTWAPADGLPPGALVAVLYGDPGSAGPFAARFKFPAGYEIPTHMHSTDELLTVLSGKGRMTFGTEADPAAAEPLVEGSFVVLPEGASHHLWIDADSIIELHSTGPFDVKLAH